MKSMRGTGRKGRDKSVLYEWVQIYASYERNRRKGTRYDQFYMSGYKSTLVMRETGEKGRDTVQITQCTVQITCKLTNSRV